MSKSDSKDRPDLMKPTSVSMSGFDLDRIGRIQGGVSSKLGVVGKSVVIRAALIHFEKLQPEQQMALLLNPGKGAA